MSNGDPSEIKVYDRVGLAAMVFAIAALVGGAATLKRPASADLGTSPKPTQNTATVGAPVTPGPK